MTRVNDQKGPENQFADNLSSLENEAMREVVEKAEIDDLLPYEHVLAASNDLIPWFTYFVNYLANDIVQLDFSLHHNNKFMYDMKKFF